jgi:hypothetical protein
MGQLDWAVTKYLFGRLLAIQNQLVIDFKKRGFSSASQPEISHRSTLARQLLVVSCNNKYL